jgi:hypothetical protein
MWFNKTLTYYILKMSFIYNYIFGETKEEVVADKKTLDSRCNLLKEIHHFNKSLLKSYSPQKKKKKLYKFKKKVKKPCQIPVP